MAKTKGRPLLSTFVIALFATASVSSAVDPRWLFARDGICGGDVTLNQCGQSGLPDNFCCPKDNTCVVLAGNTTVLCCPKGDCATISPIVCDITLQDASQHPGAAVKTTALNAQLPTCAGTKCCPFGYSCDNGVCRRDQDQSSAPVGADPSPSGTQSSTPTASATILPSTSASTTTTPQPSSSDTTESGGTPVGVIVGAVAAAILVVAALIWLVVVLRRRKNKKTDLERKNSTSSSFGNTGNIRGKTIGNPVLAPGSYDAPVAVCPPKKHSMTSSTLASPYSFESGQFGPQLQQPYEKRNSYESHTRSHHYSAEISSLKRNLTGHSVSPPRTPEQRNGRQGSDGSADITMCFQSPSTIGSSSGKPVTTGTQYGGASDLAPPPRNLLNVGGPSPDRGTVWSFTGMKDTPTPPQKGKFQGSRMG